MAMALKRTKTDNQAQPEQIIEIWPSGRNIVIHITDNELYRRLRTWQQCIWQIPYYYGDTGDIVAYDLYFTSSARYQLEKALKEYQQIKNKGGRK